MADNSSEAKKDSTPQSGGLCQATFSEQWGNWPFTQFSQVTKKEGKAKMDKKQLIIIFFK